MTKLISVFIVLSIYFTSLVSIAAASEDWFCKNEASERDGDTIKVCGVGTARIEEDARALSRQSSKEEFNDFCDMSSDCKNHKINVKPMRSSCEQLGSMYKCYRMIFYTILPEVYTTTGVMVGY